MIRTHRSMVAAAATWIVLAACGSGDASGNFNSGGNGPTHTGTPSPSGTVRQLPPRPRDIDLTNVDPCRDVLTRDQLHQLAYDLGYQRAPQPDTSRIDDARTCVYSSSTPLDQPSRDIGSLVAISTSAGAEIWLSDSRRNRTNPARQTTVDGFPGLIMPHPRIVDNCAVVIDVHDGQYLEVESSPSGGVKGTSPDPYCAEAQRVGEMVLQNLSGRK